MSSNTFTPDTQCHVKIPARKPPSPHRAAPGVGDALSRKGILEGVFKGSASDLSLVAYSDARQSTTWIFLCTLYKVKVVYYYDNNWCNVNLTLYDKNKV